MKYAYLITAAHWFHTWGVLESVQVGGKSSCNYLFSTEDIVRLSYFHIITDCRNRNRNVL